MADTPLTAKTLPAKDQEARLQIAGDANEQAHKPQASLYATLATSLAAQKAAGLHRSPPQIQQRDGKYVTIAGKKLLNCGSNDYLGLGVCKDWQRTVAQCAAACAPSASSSRLVTGNLADIDALEKEFASYFGYEDCLFMPSGYQANLALITGLVASLPHPHPVLYDKRIHASMARPLMQLQQESRRQSTTENSANPSQMKSPLLQGYAHGNLSALRRKLEQLPHESPQPILLTESLFSMDGTVLNTGELAALLGEYGAFSIVDEAHSIGAMDLGNVRASVLDNGLDNGLESVVESDRGKAIENAKRNSKGYVSSHHKADIMAQGDCKADASCPVPDHFHSRINESTHASHTPTCDYASGGRGIATGLADVVTGTLGKAMGLFGAFILMPSPIKEALSNFAPPVIYSTAMPPMFARCALAAVQRMEHMQKEREHLATVSGVLRNELRNAGFTVQGDAHIVSVLIGDEQEAVRIARSLQQTDCNGTGILAFAARYPTVPQNKAVIRFGMTALHDTEDVYGIVSGLMEVTR